MGNPEFAPDRTGTRSPQASTSLAEKLKMPKIEFEIEFLGASCFQELGEYLNLIVSRSGANLPRTPPRPLSPAADFAASPCLACSLLAERDSHDLPLLACAGRPVNTHIVHLRQAELLVVLQVHLKFRYSSGGAAQRCVVLRCRPPGGSRATSPSPLTVIFGSFSIAVS